MYFLAREGCISLCISDTDANPRSFVATGFLLFKRKNYHFIYWLLWNLLRSRHGCFILIFNIFDIMWLNPIPKKISPGSCLPRTLTFYFVGNKRMSHPLPHCVLFTTLILSRYLIAQYQIDKRVCLKFYFHYFIC